MDQMFTLEANMDGTFTVIVNYNSREEANFGLDFFSPENIQKYRESIFEAIQKTYKGLAVKAVKVTIAGILVATIPLSMMLSTAAADKYSMAYFNGGTASQQITYVNRTQNSLQTVSPSYFNINTNGSLKLETPSIQLIDTMHAQNIKVVPYLSNHWDRATGQRALENYKQLAKDIADSIAKYNLDGVNVDIENVTELHRSQYSSLMAELRRLIPADKEVSVAVAANPKSWNTGWHGSYDYKELAKHSDYLMIMTYDEHWNGGNAGPVASIGFVEKSIQYALKNTTPDKVLVGLPFFGRIWSEDGRFVGDGLNLSTVDKLIQNHAATITFDQASQSPKAEFTVKSSDTVSTVGGRVLQPGKYVVWYENDQSLEAKLKLVSQYDLKGAGSWALGQEPGSIWNNYGTWLGGGSASGGTSTSNPSGGASTSNPSGGTTIQAPATSEKNGGIALRVGSKKALVNGKVSAIDNNGSSPYILNKKTMVPLRFTSEKMGASVSWTNNNKPVTIRYGTSIVTLTAGSRTIKVTQNGKSVQKTLDQAPVLKNGRIYVPLRAVAENLGFKVSYDNDSRVIVMSEGALSASMLNTWVKDASNRL